MTASSAGAVAVMGRRCLRTNPRVDTNSRPSQAERVIGPAALNDRRLLAARRAVLSASRVTRAVQADLQTSGVMTKDDRSPVTVADYAAQAIVAHVLQQDLGPVRLVGEERADALRLRENSALLARTVEQAQRVWPGADAESLMRAIDVGAAEPDLGGFWTLDPVDGTKGFLRNQHYAVSLAYIEAGAPVLAALACPNFEMDINHALDRPGRGVLCVAALGQGAWQSALHDGALMHRMPAASRRQDLVRTCESVEAGHSNHGAHAKILRQAGLSASSVRLDSQAKYAVVARDQADVYLRLPSHRGYVEKIWDHAAGQLVAQEAGLMVSDFKGRALDYSHGRRLEKNRGIIVAAPHHHTRLVAAIRRLGF